MSKGSKKHTGKKAGKAVKIGGTNYRCRQIKAKVPGKKKKATRAVCRKAKNA